MKTRYQVRLQRRLARIAAGKRNPTDYPVPVPTTPYSKNVVPVTFDEWQLAKAGVGHPAVIRLFKKLGGYRIKPHRGSVGLIWRDRIYWWTPKGFYRAGNTTGPRPPVQHLIWEHHHGKKMPPRHEIFFRDRNRNNFTPANLELLSKGELHARCIRIGEVKQLGFSERSEIRGRWACKVSKSRTSLLLENFNRKDKHEITNTIATIRARRFGSDAGQDR